jgi:hypothetical protein
VPAPVPGHTSSVACEEEEAFDFQGHRPSLLPRRTATYKTPIPAVMQERPLDRLSLPVFAAAIRRVLHKLLGSPFLPLELHPI